MIKYCCKRCKKEISGRPYDRLLGLCLKCETKLNKEIKKAMKRYDKFMEIVDRELEIREDYDKLVKRKDKIKEEFRKLFEEVENDKRI